MQKMPMRAVSRAILVVLAAGFLAAAPPAAKPEDPADLAFDFPDLPREQVEPYYEVWSYPDRQPGPTKLSLAIRAKEWMVLSGDEPGEIPMSGKPVQIGAFHHYQEPGDTKSPFLAALYVEAARIPADLSAAEWVRRVVHEDTFAGRDVHVLKEDVRTVSGQEVRDVLFTYQFEGQTFWRRIYAFKLEDPTQAYAAGKRDLLYSLRLETDEKEYRSGAAEAFYMAKTSLEILFE